MHLSDEFDIVLSRKRLQVNKSGIYFFLIQGPLEAILDNVVCTLLGPAQPIVSTVINI